MLYKKDYNIIAVPFENSETFSFASSIIKHTAVCSAWSRFAVKLLSYIAFGSASSACCLLKLLLLSYKKFKIIII